MKAQATYKVGNQETTTTVIDSETWEKEGISRIYFTLETEGKPTKAISKLYEVVEGSTRDQTVEVGGKVFGYQLGVDCNSKSKRAACHEAAQELAEQLV